jgi:hypothetical protein
MIPFSKTAGATDPCDVAPGDCFETLVYHLHREVVCIFLSDLNQIAGVHVQTLAVAIIGCIN